MAGFSGVAPEDCPSFERWKMQIAKFIKEERIEKPILVGHSMGGGLALAIAAEFPELTGKIVIVDALPCLMALRVPDFKSAPDNDCTDLIDRITAMDEEQFAQMQRMSAATLTTDSFEIYRAAELEAEGYVKTEWGSTLAANIDIYLSNILPGITSEESVPCYYWPIPYETISQSKGKVTNGYGLPQQ